MLGFPLLYFKGMRLMMFQLSSFYCRVFGVWRLGLLDLRDESFNGFREFVAFEFNVGT